MAFICTFKLLILQEIFKIQVWLKKKRKEKKTEERKIVKNMLRPEWNA